MDVMIHVVGMLFVAGNQELSVPESASLRWRTPLFLSPRAMATRRKRDDKPVVYSSDSFRKLQPPITHSEPSGAPAQPSSPLPCPSCHISISSYPTIQLRPLIP